MEQFESYFQRADLDRDGKISGAEAVAFFRGSNLPQDVLAKIWTFADQNRVGFLGRSEFYNALKLVTVAQSKRELTNDIVKAALYGPASSKIPAPQITLAAVTIQQTNIVATSSSQVAPSQNFGFRAQVPPGTNVNQQFVPLPLNRGGDSNQYFGQAPPSSTYMNSQFAQIKPPNNVVTQQSGLFSASSTGVNPQLRQVRHSNENMHLLFRPVTSTVDTDQRYVQPSGAGNTQQYGHASLPMAVNQQFPSPGNLPVGPSVSMWAGSTSHPPLSAGGPSIPQADPTIVRGIANLGNDILVGKSSAASTAVSSDLNSGSQLSTLSSVATDYHKGLVGPVHKSSPDLNVSSARNLLASQSSSGQENNSSSLSSSLAAVPGTSSPNDSHTIDPFEALQSNFLKSSSGSNHLQTRSMPNHNQTVQNQGFSSPNSLESVASTTLEQPQESWPKMSHGSIQKYAKVFMEVDTSRIGRITGEQARKLFLSWRLPREVLKQIWDLSDQDSDSMLTLREFCIALYLMERYREGRSLPSTLPQSVMLDEALWSLAGPPTAYGNIGLNQVTGFSPPQGLSGAQPFLPTGSRSQTQNIIVHPEGSVKSSQQDTKGVSINHFQKTINGETNPSDKDVRDNEEIKKAENYETTLLDSKDKLEYYRTKMQALVLYKSRCDNRLNEITERARADKAEAEALENKYNEKYKQVAEVHSKFTLEEASYLEIQKRKMELQEAIIKIEQGGSSDGILQVRADRIQSDLEELLKAVSDRCNKHDLKMKSCTLIELPPGWEPGVPEAALVWDEEWDKFEDEGFSIDAAIPVNKPASNIREDSSTALSISPDTVLNADSISEKPFDSLATAFDSESIYSADESKSLQGSPRSVALNESPSEGYMEGHLRTNFDGDADDTHRSFDGSTWGNFNNNDDTDSVWAFNSKDLDDGKLEEKHFFGSNAFVASPERTDSPVGGTRFQNFFEDSVPSSPVSRAGNSPSRVSIDSKDLLFDSFSRYDTFSSRSPPRGTNLTRFDSISSTKYSFDDSDPFGSTGTFKVSSQTPKNGSE